MDIKDLYRQVIMDHYKNPRNKGLINDDGYLSIQMNNPSCGDEIVVQIKVDKDKVMDVKHEGKGCSICCSSASVMSETLKNKKISDILEIVRNFYEMLKGMPYSHDYIKGDLLAYHGVTNFPARIKCAALPWKALEKGLMEGELSG